MIYSLLTVEYQNVSFAWKLMLALRMKIVLKGITWRVPCYHIVRNVKRFGNSNTRRVMTRSFQLDRFPRTWRVNVNRDQKLNNALGAKNQLFWDLMHHIFQRKTAPVNYINSKFNDILATPRGSKRCPLCHIDVKDDEHTWRKHFMGESSCLGNVRTL